MENKKKGDEAETDAAVGKPKRRWKYVGQPFQEGIYLPDMITMINPINTPDADIDTYVARWQKLRGRVWKEV